MEAIYHPSNVTPAFQLDWGLTIFWRQSMIQESEWRADLASANESSGIRIIKHRALDNETSQFFISTKPDVSPSEIIRGVKGRLQSLIRSSVPKAFQRNGCKIDQSPEDIALGFLNSGAIALGMKPQFKFGYYAGTTGEYDLGAV
jgi:hypothetical protein